MRKPLPVMRGQPHLLPRKSFWKRRIWAAVAVEAAAVLIIVLTVAEATLRTLTVYLFRPAMPDAAKDGLRLRLARRLAVALDSRWPPTSCASLAPLPGEFSAS